MAQYRCEVCGHIHNGNYPPSKCPKCGAGSESFYNVEEEMQLQSILEEDVEEEPSEDDLYEAG